MYSRSIRIGALVLLASLGEQSDATQPSGAAVFMMTDDANRNEVVAFARAADGKLDGGHAYATEGRGAGGKADPLASQGSLSLSADHNWLLAANAGSGTLSVFSVSGNRLFLTDQIATEGSEPNSIAKHGHLVYVLNAAGASSVVGFFLDWGRLYRIPNSLRFLSGTAVGPGSVAFSPDGRFLVVTEKATPSIDTFKVQSDGTLSEAVVNKQVGPGTFSATFAPNGTLIVAETGPGGATNASAISSYQIQSDGSLKAISASIPTLSAATCWDVVTAGGKYVFTSNAGTSNLSGFSIGTDGSLTPLAGTIAGSNPSGSTNIDVTASSDGRFIYTLNAATGVLGTFGVDPTSGKLTNLGTNGHFAASGGANGIAAN